MLKLLSYLLKQEMATAKEICPPLAEHVRGLPQVTDAACAGETCGECVEICPTKAIVVQSVDGKAGVSIDLGSCITCGLCISNCPTQTITNNRITKTAVSERKELIVSSGAKTERAAAKKPGIFSKSIAIRLVSTGCPACDLEVGAAGNPIFDMERFGIHIVASPRFADLLLITGPVPKAMHDPLRRCYEAMSEPRAVIAVGSCAISGGVHGGSYTDANGVGGIVPVDVFVPGCPPHPWSIIDGIFLAMQRKM